MTRPAKQKQLDPDALAKALLGSIPDVAKKQFAEEYKYIKYQEDPVRFGEEVLKETYTDDIKKMMYSVRDFPVTVAMSSTAPGKTHGAAAISIWFYKCFPNSQVYTAAAPPEDNLKRLLWGEIAKKAHRNPDIFKDDNINVMNIARNEWSFLTGVTIPSTGTEEERISKFCTDADEIFELRDGSITKYRDLIGKTINVASVDSDFNCVDANAEFFDNGEQEVYEIMLSSGQCFIRTGEHPLYSGKIQQSFKKSGPHHKAGRYVVLQEKWKNVSKLEVGDAILIPKDTSFNFGKNALDPKEVKIIAYLIGDGNIWKSRGIYFYQEDNKQLADFIEAVSCLGSSVTQTESAKEKYRYRIVRDPNTRKNPVLDILKKNDLIGKYCETKRVPKSINTANKESVSLFLNRLFSTDGWACLCKTGKYYKAEIGFSSKSEFLIKDIQRLLFRFGISSKIGREKKKWKHNGVVKSDFYWYLSIWRSSDIISFAENIGIYGKEEALNQCVDYAKKRTVYASWRTGKYKDFLWDKIKEIRFIGKRNTVGVHVPVYNTYLTNIVEHNSGKHSPYLLFVLDEGDAIPDEVYLGIEGCMSGGFARLLIMFNPKREAGEAYRMTRDKTANVVRLTAFNHPNVITGENIIPGAVSREITLRRINEQTMALPANQEPDNECFQVPDFLVGQVGVNNQNKPYPPLPAGWRRILENSFYYTVLGEYPSKGSDQLISKEWINRARSNWDLYDAKYGGKPPKDTSPIVGLDVADLGDDWNAFCPRYGNWVNQIIKWRGVDPTETSERAAQEAREIGAFVVNVDSIGVGASVPHAIRKLGLRTARIMASESPTDKPRDRKAEFNKLRDQMWWEVREWLRMNESAMLPPDEALIEELLIATYEEKNGKIRVMSKDQMKRSLRRSPDTAESLALTFAPKPPPPRFRLIKFNG